jgi:sulfur carrier protein
VFSATQPPMKFTLNGEEKEAPEGTTILQVIHSMGLTQSQVAVERNLDIVPRATYAEVQLQANDKIEVVTFVGGG